MLAWVLAGCGGGGGKGVGTDAATSLLQGGSSYYVLFDNPPVISFEQIMYKGFQIGEAGDKELTDNGKHVMVKVYIYRDYVKLMHSNATFYIEDGHLEYYPFDYDGSPLDSGCEIMGFDSYAALLAFRAKQFIEGAVQDFEDISRELMKEW